MQLDTSSRSPHETLIAALLLLVSILGMLGPSLAGDRILLPAGLPYLWDPLWQPLAQEVGVEEANTILGDQYYQFHPWNLLAREALSEGRLPLWNPYINSGQPLLGNGLAGVFSPFHLLGYLLPLSLSYAVSAALRLFVAGIFTYLYTRAIGLSFPAALLSMVVFTYSGPVTVWLGFPPTHVIVWLPALLWATERLLGTRSWSWTAITGLIIAALILGGQPEVAFLAGFLWGVYLLMRLAWREGGLWAGLRWHGAKFALAIVTGALLAAIEILPFLDALRHSLVLAGRSSDVAATSLLGSLLADWHAWPTLVMALLPHFFGREADGSYWYPFGNTVEQNLYAGILPLALALVASISLLRRPRGIQQRWILLWTLLSLLSLGIALRLPLVSAINLLPPFSLTASQRLRLVYALAAAILAGFGLDLVLQQGQPIRRRAGWILALAAGANLLLVSIAYTGFVLFKDQLIASGRAFMEANAGSPSLSQPLDVLYALVEERYAAKLAMMQPSNPIMYLPLLVLLAYWGLTWLHARIQNRRWYAYALIGLALVDLLWAGYGINESTPSSWLEQQPPAVTFLQQNAALAHTPFRINATGLILNPNASMLYGLSDVRGYDAMATKRTMALVSTLDGHVQEHFHSRFTHSNARLLDLFNVKYALTQQPMDAERWQPVFQDPSGVTVYQNRTLLPRAWMVYAVEIVQGPEASLARVLDPTFDPRRQVILEESPANWTAPAQPTLPTRTHTATVTFDLYKPEEIRLHVDTPEPGLLVLADSWLPGWYARVDGIPTPIYIANHAFRAVVIPAGNHAVEFVYTPLSVRVGVIVSGSTLIALLVWAAIALWRYKRRIVPLQDRSSTQ